MSKVRTGRGSSHQTSLPGWQPAPGRQPAPGPLLSWPRSTFPSQPGPQLPSAAQGSEAIGAPPLHFFPRLWDSQALEPGPGGGAGKEDERRKAGRPPKSAPSCIWEAVAVTQVSRGPRARRERARAAPLCAVTVVKKEKPRAAPQAARPPSPGPAARPRPPRTAKHTDPALGSPRQTPAAPAGLPLPASFFFFFHRLPTCQLMDLITHSGACSSAAARSIHTTPSKSARCPWLPAPRGGLQTPAVPPPSGA